MAKQKEDDDQQVKEKQNKWKAKSLAKQREDDYQKVKCSQNNRKAKCLAKQKEGDDLQVKEKQNKWKRLSRNKRKLADPEGLAKYENEAQKKKRRLWTAEDRLREFKEATKYNAIFICSCCHRRLFHSNVQTSLKPGSW